MVRLRPIQNVAVTNNFLGDTHFYNLTKSKENLNIYYLIKRNLITIMFGLNYYTYNNGYGE